MERHQDSLLYHLMFDNIAKDHGYNSGFSNIIIYNHKGKCSDCHCRVQALAH